MSTTTRSPIYSFVDFEQRLTGISLPSYRAELAFQFYFPPELELPIDGGEITVWVADVDNNLLFQLNATVIDTCSWGVITNLNAASDFPITVDEGEIIPAGIYDTVFDLWDALQAVGITANSDVFLQCCSENLQDYTLDYTTAVNAPKTININFYRGVVYVDNSGNNQETDFENNDIAIGSCYKLAVSFDDNTTFSNTFKRVDDTKYLTFLTYSNNEDAYDFHYGDGSMVNKLWLPFYFSKPQPVTTRKIYRRSNKTYKVQFSTIEKELSVKTDYFPQEIHDRLDVALEHDNKHVFSEGRYKIDTDIFMIGEYNIGWLNNDIYDAPIQAQATFKVLKFFAGRNSNCEKRAVCIPLPVQGGGDPECTAVSVEPLVFPDAEVGVPYSHDIMFNGDGPFTVSSIVNPTSWLEFTEITGGINISGTPTEDDIGNGIEFTFHVTNCDGNGADDFEGSINVVDGEAGESNGSIQNNLGDVPNIAVVDVLLNGDECIPYIGFPVATGFSGTFVAPVSSSGNIVVRFDGTPGIGTVNLQIVLNGILQENSTRSVFSAAVTSANTYNLIPSDHLEITVF